MDFKKIYHFNSFFLRKINRKLKYYFYSLIKYIFVLIPVNEKKIVFINFNGKGYGCNPKYIAQEIIRRDLHYELIWLVNNLTEKLPKRVSKISFPSLRASYELSTARVVVTNVKNQLHFIKKNNQYLIQTWHGSYALKYVEKEIEEKLSQKYVRESKVTDKMTDLVLSNGKAQTRWYKDTWWSPCEIFESGYPRNDILIWNDIKQKNSIKSRLGLSQNKRIILYAPTFRDNGEQSAYDLDCRKILDYYNKDNSSGIILVRMHPNVSVYKELFIFDDNVVDVSTYPDMQELLLITDVLITDYSSSIFDFSLMGRPVFIFANDIEKYSEMRGLRPLFFNGLPYPICRSNEDLLIAMQRHTTGTDIKLAKKLLEEIGMHDDGNASKYVVQKIEELMETSRTRI